MPRGCEYILLWGTDVCLTVARITVGRYMLLTGRLNCCGAPTCASQPLEMLWGAMCASRLLEMLWGAICASRPLDCCGALQSASQLCSGTGFVGHRRVPHTNIFEVGHRRMPHSCVLRHFALSRRNELYLPYALSSSCLTSQTFQIMIIRSTLYLLLSIC